jgi:hypothetical protein
MKCSILLVLLCGSLVSICALADDAKGTHSRWGIVVTVTDTTTGELLEQHELDPELEYNDPVKCQAMAARLAPIHAPTNLAAALTCRRVDRSDTVLL